MVWALYLSGPQLGLGVKWGEPQATSSGRKSGGGQGEESTPEKPQQEREAEGPNHDGVALKTGQSVQTVEGCGRHRDHGRLPLRGQD